MSKTTILIDADVLAFESSIIAQENIQWEEELWTVHADMAVAKQRVLGRIEQFKDLLKADEVVLALSDRANFRRKLFPDYKSNRRKSVLPIILKPMPHRPAGVQVVDDWIGRRRPRLPYDRVRQGPGREPRDQERDEGRARHGRGGQDPPETRGRLDKGLPGRQLQPA